MQHSANDAYQPSLAVPRQGFSGVDKLHVASLLIHCATVNLAGLQVLSTLVAMGVRSGNASSSLHL